MLHKIILINTKVYQRAEINLGDCDSLQLVGPNNVGKSTLIYALNFLFIIDGNKMTFSGQRRGDKETLTHYFPSPHQSYILFEIRKGGVYTILVKRDSESNIEYYKIDSAYKKEYFVDTETSRLLKFDELKENFMQRGIMLYEYKDKREVFMDVYQRGRDNTGVVWLEDKVRMDGLSNNFSKIYRYLINTKLINNRNLKEAMIIADNRENEELNFSQKNKNDIQDLSRINNEIRNIKALRGEFEEFREAVQQYSARQRAIGELYFVFNSIYEQTIPELLNRQLKEESDMSSARTLINEELLPKQAEITKQQGKNEAETENKTFQLIEKESRLKEINSYEGLPILKEIIHNQDKKRKELESRITMIEIQNLETIQLDQKINLLNSRIESLQKQADNYSNLLIHNIAQKEGDRRLLNSILSEQLLTLPADKILKKVKNTGKRLNLFDGEIDIANGIELRDMKTLEELKDEIENLQVELKQQEILRRITSDRQEAQSELERLNQNINQTRYKIDELSKRPELEKQIETLRNEVKKLISQKQELATLLDKIKKEIENAQLNLENLRLNKERYVQRVVQLQEYKRELDEAGILGIEAETDLGLDQVYKRIKLTIEDRNIIKMRKDSLFQRLREKLMQHFAHEEDFIHFYEQELSVLEQKEQSINTLLQSISTQFAVPAHTMIKRYEEFKEFVSNNFNARLSKTRISDIESLKIELIDNRRQLDELKKISHIQEVKGQLMFDFDQSDNLRILSQYLDSGKKIRFEDLFDMTLHLTRKGMSRPVDLSEQIESDGTDKMIRLIIVMSIINRLAIHDEKNRIALFIDEVATIDKQNRPELVRFCREHHFIPIFAAPDAVPGFGKYYFIYPNDAKISINEVQNAIYASELN